MGKPVSSGDLAVDLDDFFKERQVASCPNSPLKYASLLVQSVHDNSNLATAFGNDRDDLRHGHHRRNTSDWSQAHERLPIDHGFLDRGSRRCKTMHLSNPSAHADLIRAQGVAMHASSIGRAPVLRLEQSIGKSARPGSVGMPSIGSAGHHLRQCKPCAFVATAGCSNGAECTFCHLCDPGEKKRRQKEKRVVRSTARELRNMRKMTASGLPTLLRPIGAGMLEERILVPSK